MTFKFFHFRGGGVSCSFPWEGGGAVCFLSQRCNILAAGWYQRQRNIHTLFTLFLNFFSNSIYLYVRQAAGRMWVALWTGTSDFISVLPAQVYAVDSQRASAPWRRRSTSSTCMLGYSMELLVAELRETDYVFQGRRRV